MKSWDCQIPDYKTGDVVEIEYYYSLSEKVVNTIRGLCISKACTNGLNQKLGICFWAEDTIVYWKIKTLSPLIKSIKVVTPGSNWLRKKLHHVYNAEWKWSKTLTPILKGNKHKLKDIGQELLTGDVSWLKEE